MTETHFAKYDWRGGFYRRFREAGCEIVAGQS
jgi:hypothetical protein